MFKKKDLIVKNGMDVPFFLIMLLVLAVGLVMLLSASSVYAFHYTENGDSLYYFKHQLVIAVAGVVGIYFASKLNYRYLRYFALLMWIVSIGLLIYTIIRGGDDDIKRWISFGPISFQPSEVAKLSMIIYLAFGLDRDRKKILSNKPSEAFWAAPFNKVLPDKYKITSATTTMVFYGIIIGITALAVVAGSHLSGAILIMLIGLAMLWMGECKARWFAVIGVIVVVAVVFVVQNYEDVPFLKGYMKERIKSWVDKEYDPGGSRWQINHSLYALGSGGLLGAGIGNSKQKYLYVSECHTDFIFSIIGEELGFVGCVLILALFGLLVWRGVHIGLRAKDSFGALLALGMTAQLALQVIFNIAVITDTVPNTGIPLPFFSSGGTALLITLTEMGVVLSVSRQANLKKIYTVKKSSKEIKKAEEN